MNIPIVKAIEAISGVKGVLVDKKTDKIIVTLESYVSEDYVPKSLKKHNHHHEIAKDQKIVNFGTGQFVADIPRIPLLKALNEVGLITRTHCYGHTTGQSFVSILMQRGTSFEIKEVDETHADRCRFNGMKELVICWNRKD
jgi:hypothetical protein